jgi:hypothetical protein|tara:strand:- start:1825 stop:2022 length:198 start_codon:yes stop_codon:yes gene_type:complete
VDAITIDEKFGNVHVRDSRGFIDLYADDGSECVSILVSDEGANKLERWLRMRRVQHPLTAMEHGE